jgi:hypothetical protein
MANNILNILKKIEQLITKEKKNGYKGICIETEEYWSEFPIELLKHLKDKYSVVNYYDHPDWIPDDGKLHYNAKGAYVGKLLVIDF